MSVQTALKGAEGIAYETKVLLSMVFDIINTSNSLEEAAERIARIANVEGVILEPPKSDIEKKR